MLNMTLIIWEFVSTIKDNFTKLEQDLLHKQETHCFRLKHPETFAYQLIYSLTHISLKLAAQNASQIRFYTVCLQEFLLK